MATHDSAAPGLVGRVDHVDVIEVALPAGATLDPSVWVRTMFSVSAAPGWVKALITLRGLVVPLLGVAGRPATDPFAVARVVDGEALVHTPDRHLDFAFGLRVDEASRRVLATTAVALHGWRGRLYWLPVSRFHGPVTRALLRRAAARLSPS